MPGDSRPPAGGRTARAGKIRSVHPMTGSRVVRLVAALELPVVLALAPVLLFPTPLRLVALAAIPVVWLSARWSTGSTVPRTPLNAALWMLLVMVGVSACVTPDLDGSLGKIAGVLLGVLLFWASVRFVTSAARLRGLVRIFVLAGGALAVAGLLGTSWPEKFPALASVTAWLPRSIRGLPGAEQGFHPNAVAGCLVLFVPLQVALLWQSLGTPQADRLSRVAAQAGLFALTAGTLLLTGSRGAWAGLVAALLAVLAWHSRRTRLVAGLVVVASLAAAVAVGPKGVTRLLVSQSGPGMAADIDGRIELWDRALEGIHDFPLTGMGMNMFRRAVPAGYPLFLTEPGFDVSHAHNHLLQAALDLGLPGLIAYAAVWILLAVMLVRVYRGSDAAGRAVAGGLGAGLVAHFIFGVTDAIPLGAKAGVLFWLAAAVAASLHARWHAGEPYSS